MTGTPERGVRVGIGVDAHALVAEGVPLVLGGVEFPDEPAGLAGHSDGDVIAHALIDAVLGAAGLGDIGWLFPSGDPRWQGVLVPRAAPASPTRRFAGPGYELVNADCVLVGERPRLAPVRDADARPPRRSHGRRPGARRRACDDHGRARLHGPRRGPRRDGRGTRLPALVASTRVRPRDRADASGHEPVARRAPSDPGSLRRHAPPLSPRENGGSRSSPGGSSAGRGLLSTAAGLPHGWLTVAARVRKA